MLLSCLSTLRREFPISDFAKRPKATRVGWASRLPYWLRRKTSSVGEPVNVHGSHEGSILHLLHDVKENYYSSYFGTSPSKVGAGGDEKAF